MALALVTTVGGATSNSYATLAQVATVMDELLPVPEAWATATADRKNRALVKATRILDQRMAWRGERVDDTQALEWPRVGVPKPSGLYSYDSDEIPGPVTTAQARLALFLLEQDDAGTDPFAPADAAGIQAMDLGNELSLTFEKGATAASEGARFLANTIRPILGALCFAAGQPRTVRA